MRKHVKREKEKEKEKDTAAERLFAGEVPQPGPSTSPTAPSPSRSPSSPESEGGPSAGTAIAAEEEPQPSTSKEAAKERKWREVTEGAAVRPKQVMVTHPGGKPKPIKPRKKHSLQADLDVEKEFQRCKEEGSTRLDLTKCSITTLPTSVKELSHLVEFYLYQNKLVTLPADIGNLVNLQMLAVNENSLTSLPDTLAGLKQLKVLDLRHNKLNEVCILQYNSFL
ncbi:leucine-rich repeat protein soc-2-like protein, partial [Leptotrombidium deliense]